MSVCYTAYVFAQVGFKNSIRFIKEIASHGIQTKYFLHILLNQIPILYCIVVTLSRPFPHCVMLKQFTMPLECQGQHRR